MPLFKFGMLLVRTLSKPVANAIKQRAVEKPHFRKFCADFAQGWNRWEIRLNLGLIGHSARVIKPLDEATAVKSGRRPMCAASFLECSVNAHCNAPSE